MAPTPIDLETRFVRGEDHRTATLGDDEAVVLGADLQHYYGLNSVASRVWELAAAPVTVGEICGSLVAEFEVDQATCELEVMELVRELLENALVHLVDERTGGSR